LETNASDVISFENFDWVVLKDSSLSFTSTTSQEAIFSSEEGEPMDYPDWDSPYEWKTDNDEMPSDEVPPSDEIPELVLE